MNSRMVAAKRCRHRHWRSIQTDPIKLC
jgi:hypothetical protein